VNKLQFAKPHASLTSLLTSLFVFDADIISMKSFRQVPHLQPSGKNQVWAEVISEKKKTLLIAWPFHFSFLTS